MLSNPVEFIGDEKGQVKEVICQRMELGEPDASGRRRPVPKPDSNYTIKADMVIIAVGTSANPLFTTTTPGLQLDKRQYIKTGPNGKTSKRHVWAGGDIVTGAATVIEAMGAGRLAAKDIHEALQHPDAVWPELPNQ